MIYAIFTQPFFAQLQQVEHKTTLQRAVGVTINSVTCSSMYYDSPTCLCNTTLKNPSQPLWSKIVHSSAANSAHQQIFFSMSKNTL